MLDARPTFTPTQQRIVDLLSDGRAHTREEVQKCLVDELGPVENIRPHLTSLRKILRPHGKDIACQLLNRKSYYVLVRVLASAVDGYM